MILPIYVYGQPVLRQEAQDITPDYPDIPAYETYDELFAAIKKVIEG